MYSEFNYNAFFKVNTLPNKDLIVPINFKNISWIEFISYYSIYIKKQKKSNKKRKKVLTT